LKDNESFWAKRFHTHGHTGWSDSVIYAYDQLERLTLVKMAVSDFIRPTKGLAVDFGCGNADFSKLLVQQGYRVCGYDPYVQPDFHSKSFSSVSCIEDIPFEPKTVDLVISVTALDHVLDQTEFSNALAKVHKLLRKGGILLLYEYALDEAGDREKLGLGNDYQSFRTIKEWQKTLESNSLRILKILPAPHPVFNPTIGYVSYNKSFPVKLKQKFLKKRNWFDSILNNLAAKFILRHPPRFDGKNTSPLKMLLVEAV
jgi:SAM-dependent methyltransferase